PVQAKATGHYLICTLNKHEVEAEGYHDALFLDTHGFIAEGSGANIFLVQEGKLHTPTPDSFLNGIPRQAVIGLAEKRQIPVIERSILPEEFAKTSEVFVTGTAAEVTQVAEIDDYRFTPGNISRTLMDDFRAITSTG
ncbi:MAG: aminotransferase class IV, partial [Alphaproteobacteria bacterium]|nr:aminotransferase class IV [Alphaproteobacteria bacterium]